MGVGVAERTVAGSNLGGTSLLADIFCLERKAAIPRPGMTETYEYLIEILPNILYNIIERNNQDARYKVA